MPQYKGHPIYGIGIHGEGKEWQCRGLIFNPGDKVTEIKRMECAELAFKTKKRAEEHALKLCEQWIDLQSGDSESSSPIKAVPVKDRTLAMG